MTCSSNSDSGCFRFIVSVSYSKPTGESSPEGAAPGPRPS